MLHELALLRARKDSARACETRPAAGKSAQHAAADPAQEGAARRAISVPFDPAPTAWSAHGRTVGSSSSLSGSSAAVKVQARPDLRALPLFPSFSFLALCTIHSLHKRPRILCARLDGPVETRSLRLEKARSDPLHGRLLLLSGYGSSLEGC